MDFFTGNDVITFLSELINDLFHLGDADIISVLVRLGLAVFGFALIATFLKVVFRLFWDTFGNVFRWVGRVLSSPYRLPKRWLKNAHNKRQRKQWEKQRLLRIEEGKIEQARLDQEAEEKRIEEEKKALDILNQSPDLSRFKK